MFSVPNRCDRARCTDMCVLTPTMENNVIYEGFDCICGSTARDEVAIANCDGKLAIPCMTR